MLDQLGSAQYFTTLDLAARYWQVRISSTSREKAAFVSQQGLFELHVMPFGLTNAPAVFQRLMKQVVSGLNPLDGPSFVAVYINDLLIYSRSWKEHLNHLSKVMDRLRKVNLEFCKKICGILRAYSNPPSLLIQTAVQVFPVTKNVSELHQFLGFNFLLSKVVSQFSKIASPLHYLTKKEVEWT